MWRACAWFAGIGVWSWSRSLHLQRGVNAGPGLMEALSTGTAFYGFIMDLRGLIIKVPVF